MRSKRIKLDIKKTLIIYYFIAYYYIMNRIFGLGLYLEKPSDSLRSTYYRHKHLLSKPCKEIDAFGSLRLTEAEMMLLARIAPIEESDDENLAKRLQHLPKDRKFFQMVLSQMRIWKAFASHSLEDFLRSEEGKHWLRARKRLKRKPCFELDRAFKRTKQEALRNELQLRHLLRTEPLLRFEDLQKIGFRNVQAILENFPFLAQYREKYLEALKLEYFHRAGLAKTSPSPSASKASSTAVPKTRYENTFEVSV